MKMFVGTITTKYVARLVMIISRERMYATAYIVRIYFSKFVRTYGTSIHHDTSFILVIALFSPPKMILLLSNSFI